MTLNTRNSIVLFGLIGTLVATIWVLTSKTFYAWQQERMVTRVLAANPAELLSAGRTLITLPNGSWPQNYPFGGLGISGWQAYIKFITQAI